MKNKREMNVTKQMVDESRHQGYHTYGIKKGYCDLHDCCDICNARVRFWCKLINCIEDIQTKIIKRLIR